MILKVRPRCSIREQLSPWSQYARYSRAIGRPMISILSYILVASLLYYCLPSFFFDRPVFYKIYTLTQLLESSKSRLSHFIFHRISRGPADMSAVGGFEMRDRSIGNCTGCEPATSFKTFDDDQELIRLGKKPVLKVRHLKLDWIGFWLNMLAQLRPHVNPRILVYSTHHVGRHLDVRHSPLFAGRLID